jgi:hypothetical protein
LKICGKPKRAKPKTFGTKSCKNQLIFLENNIASCGNLRMKVYEGASCRMIAGIMLRFEDLRRVFFAPCKFLDDKYLIWQKNISGGRTAKGASSLSLKDVIKNSTEILRHRQNSTWD